jgi:hypothetical protein
MGGGATSWPMGEQPNRWPGGQGRGQVPRYLSVERISVVEGSIGRVLAVLYQRREADQAW